MPDTSPGGGNAADPVSAFARAVLAGAIVAGPSVRASARRHLADLEHASGRGWRFDDARAARALSFFPRILKLNAGKFEGKPFELAPWQAFVIGSLFGWVGADGRRRFRVAYVETGKGSGKSPLAAGVGVYMLVADGEARAEVYAAASKLDQAKVLFRDAVAMAKLSPALVGRLRVIGGSNPYNIVFGDSFFRPLASDEQQSGPRPHCALVDELHEHADDTVIELALAGVKFRESPLLFAITNAGVDRNSVCWNYHQHAMHVAQGTLEDDRFFAYVCDLDPGEDPLMDEACWVKTNPSLGITIQSDYLRDQVRAARQMPSKESRVRRLHFCQWVDAATPWISGEAWRACEVEAGPGDAALEAFVGREVFLAADLSKTTDLTALAIVAEAEDGTLDAAVEFWTPGETLAARAEGDKVPYTLWRDQGWLHALPGSTIDYDHLARRIVQIIELGILVKAFVFDRYRMAFLRPKLDDLGLTLPLLEHPQGHAKVRGSARTDAGAAPVRVDALWMPESINQLEAAVLEGRLHVARNPVLTWNSASAVLVTDAQLNRIFDKRKSFGRIDGIVALAMGVGAARAPADVMDVSTWVA